MLSCNPDFPTPLSLQADNCCIDNIYSLFNRHILVQSYPNPLDGIPLGAAISIVSRGRFIFLNNHLKPLGLSAGQFPVLMLLAKEQNITQDTLVRHYHLDKGTIARTVKKLESAGFIRRIVDPVNRRAVRLFLTPKGEQVIPSLRDINSAWEIAVYSGISRVDQDILYTLLCRTAWNSHTIMMNDGSVPHD